MSLLCFQHTKELAINGKDVATIVVISMFLKNKRSSYNDYDCSIIKIQKKKN